MTTTTSILKPRKLEIEVKDLKHYMQPSQSTKSYFLEVAVDDDGDSVKVRNAD